MPTIVDSTAFLARYPEFSAIDPARLDVFLDDAEQDTSASICGDLHARVISALAAHHLALRLDSEGNPLPGADQPGAMSQAAADGVSATYQIPDGLSAEDLGFWRTVYGQEYLSLRRRCVGGPVVGC